MAGAQEPGVEIKTRLNPGDYASVVSDSGDASTDLASYGYDLGAKLSESVSLLDSGVTPQSPRADIKAAIESATAPETPGKAGRPVKIATGEWGLDQRAVLASGARVEVFGKLTSYGDDSVTGAVLGLGQLAWSYLSEEWAGQTGGGKGYPGYFDASGAFCLAPVSKWTLTLSSTSPDGVPLQPGEVVETSGNGMGRLISVDGETGAVELYRAIGTFAVGDTIATRNGSPIGEPPQITAADHDGEATYAEQFVATFAPGDKFLFVADRGYKTEIGASVGTPPYGAGGAQLMSETVEPLTATAVTSDPRAVCFEGGVPPCLECDDCWILVLDGIGGLRLDEILTNQTTGATGKVVAVNPAPLLSVILAEATGEFRAKDRVAGKTVSSATRMTEFVYGFLVLANDPSVNEGDKQYYMHVLENAVIEGSGTLVSTEFSPFHKMGAQRLVARLRSQTGQYGMGGNALFDSRLRFDYPLAREKLWDVALHNCRTLYEFTHMAPADWSRVDDWQPGVFNEFSRWVTMRGQSCDIRGRQFADAVFTAYGGADCMLDLTFVDARFGSPTVSLIQFGNNQLAQTILWNTKRITKRAHFFIRHAKLTAVGRFVYFDTNPDVVDIRDCQAYIGFAEGVPSIAAVDCRHGHSPDAPTAPQRSVLRPRISGHFQNGDVFLDAAIAPHVEVQLDNGRVAGIPDDCFVLENGLRRYAGAAYRPVDSSADPVLSPDAGAGQVGESAYETRYVLAGGGTARIAASTGTARDGQSLSISIYNHHPTSSVTPAWDETYLGTPGTSPIAPGNRSIFCFTHRSGAWLLTWSVEDQTLPGAMLFEHVFESSQYWNTTQVSNEAAIRDNAFTRLLDELKQLEPISAAVPGLRAGATYQVTCLIADRSAGNVTVALGRNTEPTNFTESGTQQIVAGEEVASSGGRSYQSELRVALGSTTNPDIKLQRVEVREM